MRLIDADELSNVMYHQAFETDTDSQKWDSGCWIRYKMFENAIADAPTIDEINACGNCKWARLAHGFIEHGHWIIDTKFGADVMSGEQMVICSVCGRGIFWGKQNYCPNCGALMDEEVDDE